VDSPRVIHRYFANVVNRAHCEDHEIWPRYKTEVIQLERVVSRKCTTHSCQMTHEDFRVGVSN